LSLPSFPAATLASGRVLVSLGCNAVLATAVLCLSGHPAAAQSFPSKPIRIVVPYPPGGAVDAVGRMLAQRLQESFGQTVLVDNRAGASGTIGSEFVARAPADGHTLLVNASIHVINPHVLKSVPFDALRDFTPVTQIASGPLLFVINPALPAKTVKEFIALARRQPGTMTFATSSLGSAGHLAEEQFRLQSGTALTIVPYKGSGPALADVIGGHVMAMIDPVLSALPHVQGGRLRALAVTSSKRLAILPNLPTVAESGLPGFEFYSWYGLWGPPGMPTQATNALQAATVKALRQGDFSERLAAQGFEPVGSTAAEFAQFLQQESALYSRIVKQAKIVVD
jgi:tripartite-type tricarboxylate transporter receptor subunit TctC